MGISEGLLFLPRTLLARKMRGGTRLTRFLANRFPELQRYPVQVPGGVLYVDLRNNSGHAYLLPEAPLTDEHFVLRRFARPGDVVFDIGANVGIFTVWLASILGDGGKVFAFEPNPAHLPGLRKTISLLQNTELITAGLSDHIGSEEFFIPEDDTMASLRDWTTNEGGKVRVEQCSVTTIDKLIEEGKIEKPDLIKCDIEGGEADCFRGAARTLDVEDAPLILFEANINSTQGFGNTISSGMEFLAKLPAPRYRFFKVCSEGALEPIEAVDFLHGNLLAVPGSRMPRLD